MSTVKIVNGCSAYRDMWEGFGVQVVESVREADIVQFCGGSDVSPHLYGEVNVRSSCDANRDNYEQKIFELCVGLKKPMVGICRGGQFLNVMNGGKMWQHVDGHAIRGDHKVLDWDSNVEHLCTSTHHQMMIPSNSAYVVGTASPRLSTVRHNEHGVHTADTHDYEVLWYESTRSLCFQPHPEFEEGECRDYYRVLLARYFPEVCS